MCRIDEFWNIHETFSHFFSKQAKLRQPNRAETADFRFQISNFEIRQIAFLMTCRPHKTEINVENGNIQNFKMDGRTKGSGYQF